MKIYAHSLDDKPEDEWETLIDHATAVGDKAAELSKPFGGELYGKAAGNLHDIGKVGPDYQHRIRGADIRVDHSTAGAVIAMERYGKTIGKILAFAIAGHHSGLANGARAGGGTTPLVKRLSGFSIPHIPQEYLNLASSMAEMSQAVPLPFSRPGFSRKFSLQFFTRMVFSALVDADYVETERFYAESKGVKPDRGCGIPMSQLRDNLHAYLEKLQARVNPSPVNELRSQILEEAIRKAVLPPGVFSLTVPTGGAKTLTSAAFAVDHAIHNASAGMRRIIYLIPYTSVIEQTADVFRDAFGSPAAVLEHHSAFDVDKLGRDDWSGAAKLRLDSQNWNSPIVVTTFVQFFESLFANRPSKCRKLHAIANSIIILDEAQGMPLGLLRPCVAALQELARGYGCTVVLCTATQPALNAEDGFEGGFTDVTEIAPNPPELFRKLKRVTIKFDPDPVPDEDLADRILQRNQTFCILNSRQHVRDVYNLVSREPGSRHLSTWMCAAHRRRVIAEIKQDLHPDSTVPVRLIATSLIEAGVDLDFRPEGFRALAGHEQHNQAAGRVNREGLCSEGGILHVFVPQNPIQSSLRLASEAAKYVFQKYGDDTISVQAVKDYFSRVYWIKGDALDSAEVGEDRIPGILRAFAANADTGDFPYADVSEAFRMIVSSDLPLIVPYGKASHIVARLAAADKVGGFAKELQQYVVQVSPSVRASLINEGHAEVIRPDKFGDQFVMLRNESLYCNQVGLIT